MAQPRTSTRSPGFTVELGSDWEILAKMHIRVPRPWARIRLRAEDLGFLTWLLSHKPGQPLSAKFAADGLDCSPDRIETICKRLEERNILVRRRLRDEAGRLRSAAWELIPPPEFQELARALAAVQGEPNPENTGLAPTSENTPSTEAKPQVNTKPVKTRSGKTRSGKSGTKVIQGKESSRERNTHTPAPSVTDGSSVVEADDVCVSIDVNEQTRQGVFERVLGTVAVEARGRMSQGDRIEINTVVEKCLAAGHTPIAIERRVTGRTNAQTVAPRAVLVRALSALQGEEPAVTHTSGTPGVNGSTGAAVAPSQRSIGVCDEHGVSGKCSACAADALVAAAMAGGA